jgi:hypothetical protein
VVYVINNLLEMCSEISKRKFFLPIGSVATAATAEGKKTDCHCQQSGSRKI